VHLFSYIALPSGFRLRGHRASWIGRFKCRSTTPLLHSLSGGPLIRRGRSSLSRRWHQYSLIIPSATKELALHPTSWYFAETCRSFIFTRQTIFLIACSLTCLIPCCQIKISPGSKWGDVALRKRPSLGTKPSFYLTAWNNKCPLIWSLYICT